ncbi:Tat pathway signal protein [Trinickia caryophylli]|nr:Tat pathway signal protein [Trinickia caryophylli]
MAGYTALAARLRSERAAAPLVDIVRCATLAANGHNVQPWHFRVGERFIDVVPDRSRRTPAVDPDDHHLFVSLGCALENLTIAATASGRPGEALMQADGVRYAYTHAAGDSARAYGLADAIGRRQSTRAEYDGRPVAASDLAALERMAAEPGVRVVVLTDRKRLSDLRELVVEANDAQMRDQAFLRELSDWLRFNPRAAMAMRDGLFSAASGQPVLPDTLGRMAFRQFFSPTAERGKYARQLASSAGVAVFVGEQADTVHWMRVGRACQRFLLLATRLGLRTAFVNQPVEVPAWRADLAALIGERGKRPDLVVRFGYGRALPFSLRRDAASVIVPA